MQLGKWLILICCLSLNPVPVYLMSLRNIKLMATARWDATKQQNNTKNKAGCGAMRRGGVRPKLKQTPPSTHSLLLPNQPPLHYLTTFIFASAHLLSTFPHVHQLIRSSTSQHFADQRYYLCFSQFSINEKAIHHSPPPF